MPYPATAVANYFIRQGQQSGSPVDPMKLQKLVYFAHGWHLAVYGRPLINERVEAWQYGPVVPTIYHEVKTHGSGPIDFPIFAFDGQLHEPPQVPDTDSETMALLNRVWEVYGRYSSVDLSRMSHDARGPWHKTWHEDAGQGTVRGVDIPDERIQSYFVDVARKDAAA